MHALLQWLAVCFALCFGLANAATGPAITVLHTQPYVSTVNPASEIRLSYRFRATGPTTSSQTVFVHFVDAAGNIVSQDDHLPPAATTQWYGDIVYERFVKLPSRMAPGRYRIAIGLYNRATGQRTALGTVADPASTEPSYVDTDPSTWARYIVGEVYVTAKQIVEPPFVCNGNDVTEPLARAIRSIGAHQVLKLPSGSCHYGSYAGRNAMRLDQRIDVEVVGQGAPSTRLMAREKLRSGFIISGSSNILLRDFKIEVVRAPGYAERTGNPDAIGVYVERSSNIELRKLAILNPLGPGIQFFRSTDSRAMQNFVQRSAADGIHVAGPSSNITFDGNVIFDSGDDGLSSIGYATGIHAGANHNITITNNRVRFRDVKWGSGIAVEGTTVAKVLNNYIERSGSAGIRVGSISGYADMEGSRQTFQTGGVTSAEIAGNELVEVETRADFNQGAIHIAAMAADVSDIQISSNKISSASLIGTTTDAIRILGRITSERIYYVKDIQIWNNAIHNTRPGILGEWCISRLADTTMNITLADAIQRQYLPNTYQNTEYGGARDIVTRSCTAQRNG